MCIFCCFMKIPNLILRDSAKTFRSLFRIFLMLPVAVNGVCPCQRCHCPRSAPLGTRGPHARWTALLRGPQATWLDCCPGSNPGILQRGRLSLVCLRHFSFHHLKVTCPSVSVLGQLVTLASLRMDLSFA